MINIIDCGLGNINSISKCVEKLGFKYEIIREPNSLDQASKIIFPGVGSFSKAMEIIHSNGWYSTLIKKIVYEKKNFLGICLGMQLLADFGFEFGKIQGLSIISGSVKRIDKIGCKQSIPHIGWNDVSIIKKNRLFEGIENNTDFYFDHSFSIDCVNKEDIIATTCHDVDIVAAVNRENIFGTQFHPEKSSDGGKQLLYNFLKI